MTIDDFRALVKSADDDTLASLRQVLDVELTTRRHRVEAEEVLDGIAQTFSLEAGRTDGDEWVQPTGAHDAYPKAAVVAHKGKTWVNLTPANVWEPGVSGWREDVAEDSAPPEFVQPTGAHDAYSIGDLVTFDGAVYRSRIDGNVWSPMAHPAGWVSASPVPPAEDEAPEPEPWVQPTGAHDAYSAGDLVTFGGETYRSLVDSNTWSPAAYPAGWEKV